MSHSTTSLARADGYLIGAQPRALVLDLLAEQHRLGRLDRSDDHPALDLDHDEFAAALISLAEDGFASSHKLGTPYALTAAGLAAHAETLGAVDDLTAAVDRLPVFDSPFAIRRAAFGAHAG